MISMDIWSENAEFSLLKIAGCEEQGKRVVFAGYFLIKFKKKEQNKIFINT